MKQRRTLGPNVVIFEHNHTRQIHAVSVDAANQHGVLFDHTESRSSFARTGNETFESVADLNLIQSVSPGIIRRIHGHSGIPER